MIKYPEIYKEEDVQQFNEYYYYGEGITNSLESAFDGIKDACFNLFAFSIRNSETDGWIFMLIAHSYAPFIVGVAVGVIDYLIATGIYSLWVIKR